MSFTYLSGVIQSTNTNFSVNNYILPTEVERYLKLPLVDGQILASDINGTRYWTNSPDVENLDSKTINTEKLRVTGDINLDDNVKKDTASKTTFSTNPVTLFDYDILYYDTCDAIIKASSNNRIHVTKLIVASNSSVAMATEYGTLQSHTALFTVDVDISVTKTRIIVTPTSSAATVFKTSYELLSSASTDVVGEGLILYLDAADPLSYTGISDTTILVDSDFNSWAKINGVTILSTTELAPNSTNTATTLQDSSTTAFQYITKDINVTSDYRSYTFSIYVKKTTGGTSPWFLVQTTLLGGTIVQLNARINTDTGQTVNVSAGGVTSVGDYWKMTWTLKNNRSGNNLLRINIHPAGFLPGSDGIVFAPQATGQATIWGLEVKTNPMWYDLSGSNNNSILFNGIDYTTDGGGGMVFDGVDSYVDIGDGIQLADNFTVEIWHKNINASGELLDQGNIGSDSTGRLEMRERGLLVRGNNDADAALATGTITNTSGWNTVTASFSGGVVTFYINGFLDSVKTIPRTAFLPGGSILKVGRMAVGGFYLSGIVSVVKVYNRVLNDGEVLQNYNALRGRYGLS